MCTEMLQIILIMQGGMSIQHTAPQNRQAGPQSVYYCKPVTEA